MGSPDVKAAEPAERPERIVEVEAEDIELGTADQTKGTDLKTMGKRALTKPSGGAPVAGLSI